MKVFFAGRLPVAGVTRLLDERIPAAQQQLDQLGEVAVSATAQLKAQPPRWTGCWRPQRLRDHFIDDVAIVAEQRRPPPVRSLLITGASRGHAALSGNRIVTRPSGSS